MDDSYFLILADQNLRPLKQKLKKWGAFFTGIGYAVPQRFELESSECCKTAGLKIYKQPLPLNMTFDSFEQSHRTSFLKDRVLLIQTEISLLKREIGWDNEIDPVILENSSKGQRLLQLIENEKNYTEQLRRSENFEKALALSTKQNGPEIKFLSEQKVNMLLDEAPEMPRLINFWDGSIQRPFLRKGILGMLVGAGGVGKTSALAQLALSIATGSPWLGIFPVEKPGSVFLGLGENKNDDIHRLLRKVAKHFLNQRTSGDSLSLIDPDPLAEAAKRIAAFSFSGLNSTFIQQGMPTPFFENLLSGLIQAEPEEGWSCIILDPISRFIGMDAETDNASATQFIALLEKLLMELKGNPTIVFGHHMNKLGVSSSTTNQAAARGSSAITDGVRWQVNLEKSSQEESSAQEYIFRHVKSNFTAIFPKITLKKDIMGCFYQEKQTNLTREPVKIKEYKKTFVKIGNIGEGNGEL